MFDFLKGELARKEPGEAVVEVNGVGYLLAISLQSYTALPPAGAGAAVRLFVHVHSNDSGTRLFGFADEAERSLFRLLQSVRGVGPAVALTLLSHEAPAALAARIQSGDVKGLTRIKGIGTKTSERLVLELKNKLAADLSALAPGHEEQLSRALQSLGLDPREAGERARAVVRAYPGEERVEVLLRSALRARGAAS